MGYRDVLNTIHESHDYIPIRPSYILQLHRDLLQYAQESFGGPFADSLASLSECDPVPFIKYLLGIILSCYRDFEERVDMMGKRSTAYDIVKKAVGDTLGKFTKQEILEHCPSLKSSSVESALKKLREEGFIEKHGSGRNTFYVNSPR